MFFLAIAFTIIAVFLGHKKTQSTSSSKLLETLLMGRALTLPLFVATLVSTWYGGLFGVTAIAYKQGIYNFITQGFFWYISYIIFALFLVPKIAKHQALTLPDLAGKLFGHKAAKITAIFNFINVLPIAYTISLGLFFQLLFGGPLWLSSMISVFLVSLYASFGGFRAVVYSDLVQFVFMMIGVILVLVFSISHYGGLSFLVAQLPESHWDPKGGENWSTLFVWGFIAISTLVDPNFYQRCFAAKSPEVARKGILISTLIWIFFDLCTTGGALYAKAVMPDLNPQNAYFIYALNLLPQGLKGIFLAGVFCTIVSTLDSYLFLGGVTLGHDLFPNFLKRNKYRLALCVLFSALTAYSLSFIFEGNIKLVWKTLGSLSAASLLLPLLLGQLLPNFVSSKGFTQSVLVSSLGVLLWTWNPQKFFPSLDSLYIGIILSLLVLPIHRITKINHK